jgi:UDP-N-acetyl-D-mannosaminuronic acid dehydrogenase
VSDLVELREAVASRDAVVCVVGLGYVGLPVALTFTRAGFRVIGIDVDEERLERIGEGSNPIEGGEEPGLSELLAESIDTGRFEVTGEPRRLGDADIVTINVQTPVDSDQNPNTDALVAASRSIGTHMSRGTLVIVESTVAPGTTMGLVRPILETESGLDEGEGFFVGSCPERVMPGRLLANIQSVPRVCGGSTPEVAETMRQLYATVVEADLDTASTTTAELVKVVENTYRDVQIAFANEVALICSDLGEDVWRVRELVNKVPFRQMHYPGGGVGGHCIPKDPWLLAKASPRDLKLIPAAREVNDGMPAEIARLAKAASERLIEDGEPREQARRVLVLGYAYLPETDDARNSPSAALTAELARLGLEVAVHDPFVPGFQGDVNEMAEAVGTVVTMVHHAAYRDLDLRTKFEIDAQRLSEARARLKSTNGARRA